MLLQLLLKIAALSGARLLKRGVLAANAAASIRLSPAVCPVFWPLIVVSESLLALLYLCSALLLSGASIVEKGDQSRAELLLICEHHYSQ